MRLLFKLLLKLAMFAAVVMLSAGGLRQGAGLFSGGSAGQGAPVNLGADGAPVTKEESDLTGTVFKSALKLVTGQATRSEMGKELNEKLYGQRGDPGDMAELGIELVGSKGSLPGPLIGGNAAAPQSAGKPGDKTDPKLAGKPGNQPAGNQPGAKPAAGAVPGTATPQTTTLPGAGGASPVAKLLSGPEVVSGKSKAALSEILKRIKRYSIELSMVPVVFIVMAWVARARRKKREAGFVPEYMAVLPESDSEKYTMKHQVEKLTAEEFELLVALIYQRQGYRISMPAALASGNCGRFKLARKAERILVQCHNFKDLHRVEIQLVSDFHEAMADANVTGGLFVASCGYSWDARHFAKTKNIKLVSGKTLDILLNEACATPDEKLLEIAPWLPKFMTKVEMTTPRCPECDAEMDETKEGDGSVWLCNQRPECGGRRDVRKYRKAMRIAAQDPGIGAAAVAAPKPAAAGVVLKQREPGQQPRSEESAPTDKAPRPVKTAGAVSTRPAAPEKRDLPPKTQAETPKPASGPLQNGGKGTSATPRNLRSFIPNQQRCHLPEILRGKLGTPSNSAQAEGADSRQTNNVENPQPGSSKPTPLPAEGDLRTKSGDAVGAKGSVPEQESIPHRAAQTAKPNPAPDPTRGTGVKKYRGLLSSVVDDFKSRGFRLDEKPLVKPKTPPDPAQCPGAGSTPPKPQKRTELRMVEAKTAPSKAKSKAA